MTFSSSGLLSGTPTATASGSITFRATNAYGFADRALTLTVSAAGAGPVLVTAPVITAWSGSTTVVENIIYATPGVWVNEPPSVLSGVTGASDVVDLSGGSFTLYLGVSASTNAADYVGNYIQYLGADYYPYISAYNTSTKVATVVSAPALPITGNYWHIIKDYPLQRIYQWYRDGVAIPNACSLMYTTQAADIGKTLYVTETVGTISALSDGYTYEIPTITTTAQSGNVGITGTVNPLNFVRQDNVQYIGSFKTPGDIYGSDIYPWDVNMMDIVPSAYSQNGQQSLIFNKNNAVAQAVELSIPADGSLTTSSNFADLVAATVTRKLDDPYNGQWNNCGLDDYTATTGLKNLQNSYFDYGSGASLLSSVGFYTGQQLALVWSRPTSTASTGTVNGPFFIVDTAKNQYNSRFNAGSFLKIPAAYRTSLGGDLLVTNKRAANTGAGSTGPNMCVIDSAQISSTTTKVEAGTARNGSSNTIQLALSATGATTDYYKNWFIYAPSARDIALRVTAYNATTKTCTVEAFGPNAFTTAPTSSTTYKLYPYLNGTQISLYNLNDLDPYMGTKNRFTTMWNSSTFPYGMFWPAGTDSVVHLATGGNEFYQYGIRGKPNPVAYDSAVPPRKVYSALKPGFGSTEPISGLHADGAGIRFISYSAADMVLVKNGTLAMNAIKPVAAWSMRLPTYTTSKGWDHAGLRSCTYDNSTKRLYVAVQVYNQYASTWLGCAIHVFNITNASVA
jgi:hypothetical protein